GFLLFDHLALDRANLDVEAELVTDELGLGRIEQVVHHPHDAELEQRLDHFAGFPAHLFRELGDGHRLAHLDELALDLGRRRFDGGHCRFGSRRRARREDLGWWRGRRGGGPERLTRRLGPSNLARRGRWARRRLDDTRRRKRWARARARRRC